MMTLLSECIRECIRGVRSQNLSLQMFLNSLSLLWVTPSVTPPPSGDMFAVCAAFIFSGTTWRLKAASWKCLCIQTPRPSNEIIAVSADCGGSWWLLSVFFAPNRHLSSFLHYNVDVMFCLSIQPDLQKVSPNTISILKLHTCILSQTLSYRVDQS